MTIDQFIDDATAVARYLCDRFHQQKVYVRRPATTFHMDVGHRGQSNHRATGH